MNNIEKIALIETLLNGYTIEFGKLSVCCINDYYHGPLDKIKMQVHCEHYKLGGAVSELFDTAPLAIDRFLELKGICYERKS